MSNNNIPPTTQLKNEECYEEETSLDCENATNLTKIKARSTHHQDTTTAVISRCTKCKTRLSRRGCSDSACLLCCTDENCAAHAESREKAKCNDNILNRTTDIAHEAKRQRGCALKPGTFREGGFLFTEQSIKIWDIGEFMANQKWKEDAIRRSQKRKAREENSDKCTLKICRKRFHALIEERYNNSSQQNESC